MAITFIEKRKRLKYLIPVLGAIILIIAFIFWYGFFAEKKAPLPDLVLKPPIGQEIEIDFQLLRNPIFEKLTPFEQIPVIEEEIGRENPFAPF